MDMGGDIFDFATTQIYIVANHVSELFQVDLGGGLKNALYTASDCPGIIVLIWLKPVASFTFYKEGVTVLPPFASWLTHSTQAHI